MTVTIAFRVPDWDSARFLEAELESEGFYLNTLKSLSDTSYEVSLSSDIANGARGANFMRTIGKFMEKSAFLNPKR